VHQNKETARKFLKDSEVRKLVLRIYGMNLEN